MPCCLRTKLCFPDSAVGKRVLRRASGSLMGLSLSLCRPTPGELVRGAAASPRRQHCEVPLLRQGQPCCHPVQVRWPSQSPAPHIPLQPSSGELLIFPAIQSGVTGALSSSGCGFWWQFLLLPGLSLLGGHLSSSPWPLLSSSQGQTQPPIPTEQPQTCCLCSSSHHSRFKCLLALLLP